MKSNEDLDKEEVGTETGETDALLAVLQDRAEIELATRQISAGERTAEDFAEDAEGWKSRASLFSACQMIRHGFADPEDFDGKKDEWIASASPDIAAKMIRHGLADIEDFSEREETWFAHPQYSFVRDYVSCQHDAATDARVRAWIDSATFLSALMLVADGYAVPSDFAERVSSWVDFGPKDRLDLLVRNELMSSEDANDTRNVSRAVHAAWGAGKAVPERLASACLQYGDGSAVHRLLAAGVVSREDCADRVDEWLAEASAENAPFLVRYGFATVEDMRARIADQLKTVSIEQAPLLVGSKVVTREEVMSSYADSWRRFISPKTLPIAYGLGIVSKDEALDLFRLWGDEGLMEDFKLSKLVRSRLDGKALMGRKVIGRFQTYRDGGAVIRVNGFMGFVQQSDVNWLRAARADLRFNWGDMVECSIVRFSSKDLVLKFATQMGAEDPISKQYPVGIVVRGVVSSVKQYGLFIDIAPGLTGFVFKGEVSWSNRTEALGKAFTVGDSVKAVVLAVDEELRRITLSIKRLTRDPWEVAAEKVKVGSRMKGTVCKRAGFGLFVEVSPGVSGLVHRTEMSWNDRDARQVANYHVGDEVEVVVKEFDAPRRRIFLSIKDTLPNPWIGVEDRFPVGSVVKGVLRRSMKAYGFVEVESGISAILHFSECRNAGNMSIPYKVGDEVEARVISVCSDPHTLRLSVIALDMGDEEFAAVAERERKALEEKRASASRSAS